MRIPYFYRHLAQQRSRRIPNTYQLKSLELNVLSAAKKCILGKMMVIWLGLSCLVWKKGLTFSFGRAYIRVP